MSVRQAYFSLQEECDVKNSIGKILADSMIGCPPAVSVVLCGERVDESDVKCFEYYGINKVKVVKE